MDISLKLSSEGLDTITQSLDVSASGVYCKVNRHIPLMARVQLVLSMPVRTAAPDSTILNIDGVVVREHPVIKDGKVEHYDVAIFFDGLLPKERKLLIQYINHKSK